jgi:hypothetical protein
MTEYISDEESKGEYAAKSLPDIGGRAESAERAALQELPDLPEPTVEDYDGELWGQNVKFDLYTAEQMRAYAVLARAATGRQPLTDKEIERIWEAHRLDINLDGPVPFVRAVLAGHSAGASSGEAK